MRIDRTLEEKQAGCASIEWHCDGHQYARAGSEDAASGTEGDVSGYIGGGEPVQVTLIT